MNSLWNVVLRVTTMERCYFKVIKKHSWLVNFHINTVLLYVDTIKDFFLFTNWCTIELS
jgi:hypothetical protein